MPALIRTWSVLLALAVLPAAAGASSPVPTVSGVAFTSEAGQLTVRVDLTERPRSFSVDHTGRTVQLTVVGVGLASAMERGQAAPPVRAYRVETFGDRVVLTFDAPDAPMPRASLAADGPDVLLTFGGAEPRRVVAWGGVPVPSESRTEPRTAPRRRRVAPRPAEARAPTQIRASAPVRPVQTVPNPAPAPSAWANAPAVIVPLTPEASAQVTPSGDRWRLDTIVLDAGHGGHDMGATYNGVREKDVTLGIVRHLGRMIEQEMGVRVVYTRRDDHFEELRERGRIANRSGGKLFVSIHANAAGSGSASGTETYFLAPHRTENAHEVMERENAVIQLESTPSLYAEYTGQGNILEAMAMSAYQEESQTLARLVEHEFEGQSRRSRGVKQAGFLVLWAASMPAILVETGFVSNADEARLLGSASGQEQTARAVFRAIASYRDSYERGLRLASR